MNDFVDMKALDAHFAKIARQVYLEEHAKEAGMSKRELHELVRMMVQQRAFNRKDAAKYIGHSPTYINKLVKEGLLESTVNHGSTYYLKESLDAYLESGTTTRRTV